MYSLILVLQWILSLSVEWSSRADFSNVCGTREVTSSGTNSGTKVLATGLTRGRRYFFRASAGNIKGWGPYVVSVPRSVVPSSKLIFKCCIYHRIKIYDLKRMYKRPQ